MVALFPYTYQYVHILGFFPLSFYILFYCTTLFPVVNCGDPGTPSNGRRTGSSTTYNSVVTYTCNTGYTRQGSSSRTCQSNGQWSGSLPRCNRKFCFVLIVLYIVLYTASVSESFGYTYVYTLCILTAPVRIVALAQQVTHLFHTIC